MAVHAPASLPGRLRSLVKHPRSIWCVVDPALRNGRGSHIGISDDVHALVLVEDLCKVYGHLAVELVDEDADQVWRSVVNGRGSTDLVDRSVACSKPLDAVGVPLAPHPPIEEHAVLLAPIGTTPADQVLVAAAESLLAAASCTALDALGKAFRMRSGRAGTRRVLRRPSPRATEQANPHPL